MPTADPQAQAPLTAAMLHTRGRLGAHALWDHITNPEARTPAEVPWRADAISTEFLTPVLCAAVPGAAVDKADIFGGSSGSSVRRAIRVQYNGAGQDAGLTEQFFAKATPTVLTRLTSGWRSTSPEAEFYRQIRPELSIEAPIHVFSSYDGTSGRTFHLWEDLTATRGARFCDYSVAFDRGQAEQAIDMLAGLHGRFYDSPRLTGDLAWIRPYEDFYAAGVRGGLRTGHDRAMIAAAHLIPADVIARKDEIWAAAERALAVHASEPRTAIHSDVHLGNWYITDDDRVGLCDWQCLSTGSWARDVAYALATVLDVEDRRAWERDLLIRYLAGFQAAGGPAIELERAWTLYKRQMFAALLMWTPTLVHGPAMPDMQPEHMSFEMIRRMTAAISDLKALDAWQSDA